MAIRAYCKSRRLHNIQWVAETISGTKKPAKRKLGNLLDCVQSGDTIICTELSRLGRSLMMILNVLQELLERGVKVIAIKEGYELGDNIQSKVLAFAFGLSAEIERTLLSERTKQGLERARKEGKQIGRLKGQTPKRYKLSGKAAFIRRNRLAGRKRTAVIMFEITIVLAVRPSFLAKTRCLISSELSVTWATFNSFMRRNGIN